MIYKCTNEQCSRCGQEEYLSSERFRYRDGQLRGEHIACPECGRDRELITEQANVPLAEKAVNLNMYSALSAEQKRESLKRRSHEHFSRHLRETKEGMIRKARDDYERSMKETRE